MNTNQLTAITDQQLQLEINQFVSELSTQFKKVLVITPDITRTCPLERIIPKLQKSLIKNSMHVDYLVALGTHRYMEIRDIETMYGIDDTNKYNFDKSEIRNHRWKDPGTFKTFGSVELIEGDSSSLVDIQLNKCIEDYDVLLPISPVFPHEIVGFSGGPKYFFPGISGGEFLQKMHWHAVCIGREKLMGIKDTPTRRLIDRAARLIPKPVRYITMAVDMHRIIRQFSYGKYHDSWDKTVEVSKKIHIRHVGRQYKRVVAKAPEMYSELWTAGKAMYKIDQIVETGGKLILYGPHIKAFSHMWNKYVYQMGFHTIDYLLANEEKFNKIPRGVLSFSANVRGQKKEHSCNIDEPRVDLVMATGIPEKECDKVNLTYMDHQGLDWKEIEKDPDTLVVEHAGEILHLV